MYTMIVATSLVGCMITLQFLYSRALDVKLIQVQVFFYMVLLYTCTASIDAKCRLVKDS